MCPFSVGMYLRFAIGDGLADPSIERDLPCAGLEAVGKPFLGTAKPTSPASGASMWYGDAADRIGQTAACWLSRWAAEVLPYEEAQSLAPAEREIVEDDLRRLFERMPSARPPSIAVWSVFERGGLTDRWARALVGSDGLYMEPTRGGRDDGAEADDAVGTSSELQRYDLSKRVVELRRRQRWATDDGVDESIVADEAEYAAIFEEGIYLSHLVRRSRSCVTLTDQSFAELRKLASDISPSTKRPYVPSHIIHRALWLSTELVSTLPTALSPPAISTRSAAGMRLSSSQQSAADSPDATSSFRSSDRDDLGLAVSLRRWSTSTPPPQTEPRRYWLLPVDATLRLNDADLGATAATDPPDEADGRTGLRKSSSGEPRPKSLPLPGLEDMFGLSEPAIFASPAGPSIALTDDLELERRLSGRALVSTEPFRWSVEFSVCRYGLEPC